MPHVSPFCAIGAASRDASPLPRGLHTGSRACIGRQFTLHEAPLVPGTLLRRCDLRAHADHQLRRYDLHVHADHQLKVPERLTLMRQGFTVTLAWRARR